MSIFSVSIAKGNEYKSTLKALTLISDKIKAQLKTKSPKTILLKPNLVYFSPPNWLPITKLDTIRATVNFFSKLGRFKFIVADSAPTIFGWNTKQILDDANYWQLEKEYKNLKVLDLNDKSFVTKFSAVTQAGPKPIKVAKLILEADYLVSLAKIKTHDTFLNTLSIKNIIMGAIAGDQKVFMHGTPSISSNSTQILKTARKIKYLLLSNPIAKPLADFANKRYLAAQIPYLHANHLIAIKYLYPDLAIIDGGKAMEGDGPSSNQVIPLGITIASTDALSADLVATIVMGFKAGDIAYLDILKDKEKPKYEVIGQKLTQFTYHFKPHQNYSMQNASKDKVISMLKFNSLKYK